MDYNNFKKVVASLFLSFIAISIQAQHITNVKQCAQQDMGTWGVPGANYSGIARIGKDDYALVSDKEKIDGFYPFTINIDSITGNVKRIFSNPIIGEMTDSTKLSVRDQEGIAYDSERQTVFISGEGDQRIIEQTLTGMKTGAELAVPEYFSPTAISPNYGFEALTYSCSDKLFWTTTEQTLKADGSKSDYGNRQPALLRLQSFGKDLKPLRQYAYRMDAPEVSEAPRQYAYGVVALTALEDGTLLVLEREFFVAQSFLGSWVKNKLYHIHPKEAKSIDENTKLSSLSEDRFLKKEKVTEFTTKLSLTNRSLANYEGMCLGPRLADGRFTLLLVSDSQNNYGNRLFHLKDFIKVITFEYR